MGSPSQSANAFGGYSGRQGSGQQRAPGGAALGPPGSARRSLASSRGFRRGSRSARGGRDMDCNPSPPPPSRDEDEEAAAGGDCIGSTVYSKHWLFGVLSGLIQVRKRASSGLPTPRLPPRLGQPLLPLGAAVPLTTLPRPGRPGSYPWPPGCLPADPKTAGRHFVPSVQTEGNGRDAGMLLVRMFYFTKFPNIRDRVNALLTCSACDAVGFCASLPLSFLKLQS